MSGVAWRHGGGMAKNSSANETTEETTAEAPAEAAEVTIQLAPVPQLREAEELMDQINDIDEEAPILIDASEIEAMITPVVLTLVSAVRTRAASEGGKIAVQSPPAAFVDAFTDLGLFQDLMKMEFRT